MKKIFFYLLIILLTCSKAYSIRQDGSGKLKLSNKSIQHFKDYLRGKTSKASKGNKPLVFWITEDGEGSYFWYCASGQCRGGSPTREKLACEEAYGKVCWRFARKSSIRWKNGINPGKGGQSKFSSLMSDQEIVAKLTSLGFVREKKKAALKKKPKKSKSSNQLEKMQALKKLFDDGIITPEEFLSRKKIILN